MPLRLGHYSAQICCNEQELEQYDMQLEDEKTVACWIASESGKEFAIQWEDEPASTIMQVVVLVDGRIIKKRAHDNCRRGTVSKVEDSPGCMRSIHFSPLILTDDDNIASSAALNEDLGVIEIQMRKVAYFTKSAKKFLGRQVPEIGPIHERSKKSGVHAVALGKVVKITKPSGKLMAHGLQEDPFATFKFRYRPIDVLRANGIAPLPPKVLTKGKKRPSDVQERQDDASSSTPKRQRTVAVEEVPQVKPEQVSDVEDDSEDDDRATFLEEQLVLLQSQLSQLQAKKKSKAVVKREPSPIQVPAAWTNEVIDLT